MWIYERNIDNSSRYILGEIGVKNLIVIGVNPSTSEPNNLDQTLKNVKTRSNLSGFDCWLMINLYPQRTTNPSSIHKNKDIELFAENLRKIKNVFYPKCTIWAAWGTLINKRSYLFESLEHIYKLSMPFDSNWISFGNKSKDGHPHHPLYLRHDLQPENFDIKSYLERKI